MCLSGPAIQPITPFDPPGSPDAAGLRPRGRHTSYGNPCMLLVRSGARVGDLATSPDGLNFTPQDYLDWFATSWALT
jgi:hypothetical protein